LQADGIVKGKMLQEAAVKIRLNNLFIPSILIGGLFLILASQLAAQTVTQIAAGEEHSLFVKSDGSLWGMGNNGSGQLGLGSALEATNLATEIVTNGVRKVAAGYAHSLFENGNAVWAMGNNEYGQLGDGTGLNHYVPEAIYTGNEFVTVTALGAGSSNSFYALSTSIPSISKYSYGLWAMGWNGTGQLGVGNHNNYASPTNVFTINVAGQISSVVGGSDHSLYVLPDGSLWAMGDDTYGQLGTALQLNTNLPQMVVSSGVTAVAAGYDFSVFLESDSALWATGDNQSGQNGIGSETAEGEVDYTVPQLVFSNLVVANVIAVAAGYLHCLCITSDGILWGAGDNSFGQLGQGSSIDVLQFGYWFPIARNVVAVAAGQYHTLFVKSDGSLWGMGYNGYGQLGTGDYLNRYVPVEIVPPPQPVISSIGVPGSNVVVTWPTNQGGFYLESTTNLALSAAWSAVSAGPVIANGQFTVTNPVSASQQFYQLIDSNAPSPPLVVTTLPVDFQGLYPTTANSATPSSFVFRAIPGTTNYIEYGLTTNYGSKSARTTFAGSDTNSQIVSVEISGLSANTTYHFQAVEYSISATNYGGDLTFSTPP
jgi:alpha-tubulin suppressor-like RCC1 family protein